MALVVTAEKNRASVHKPSPGIGIFLAILLAVLCGLLIGSYTAVLRIRQYPWKGGFGAPLPPSGGHVAVDREEFNFGKMDSSKDGKHEFVITNRGDHNLTLNRGSTSCSCTVSEIKDSELAPGQSTKALVSWHSKGRVGPFKQTVTIISSDPLRREITLTIQGEYTRAVYAEPFELTFGPIADNNPVTRESRILCSLPNQQIKILGYKWLGASEEKFFQVDYAPLSGDELRKHAGATSGVLVRVTVKPGLPLGPFQQRILLSTNVPEIEELELPLFGTVGEVTLVGPGWSSETGVLDIGKVDGRSVTQRRLVVLARGPSAKDMKFKVVSVEPDYLKVNLGKTTVAPTGGLSQTELLIEIPESKTLEKKAPVAYLGGSKGKLAEILLETTDPPVHSLWIRVRFAVMGGT